MDHIHNYFSTVFEKLLDRDYNFNAMTSKFDTWFHPQIKPVVVKFPILLISCGCD